jgi:hypothetical protein
MLWHGIECIKRQVGRIGVSFRETGGKKKRRAEGSNERAYVKILLVYWSHRVPRDLQPCQGWMMEIQAARPRHTLRGWQLPSLTSPMSLNEDPLTSNLYRQKNCGLLRKPRGSLSKSLPPHLILRLPLSPP